MTRKDWPNMLTSLRLVLVGPVVIAILERAWSPALTLMATAALSDLLDGWLARKLQASSAFGAWLDPVADKTLLVASLTALMAVGLLPLWFWLLTLARDAIVVGGALAYRLLRGPYEAHPLWSGKLAIGGQMVVAVAALVVAEGWLAAFVLTGLLWLVTIFTIASGVTYVFIWWQRYRQGGAFHG